jgi:hypothetical protein
MDLFESLRFIKSDHKMIIKIEMCNNLTLKINMVFLLLYCK